MTYGGKAIVIQHLGAYENLAKSWEAIYAYATTNGLELNGVPFEEYENSPVTQQDASQLITNIYLPIK